MVSKSALRKQISNFELFPPFNYDEKIILFQFPEYGQTPTKNFQLLVLLGA